MDEQQQSGSWDAWIQATAGYAIGAYVDRELRATQGMYDPAQAYGVDQSGRVYQLGQTNQQITATVAPTVGGSLGGLMPWLIIGAVILFATSGRK
ncbi:hypothetical protein [Massilia sp. DD77]|uniref:hypothetical protein n=1 Tax=Massilia sp. DD77 TaxID=3109349 RepID=UPI002FFE718A